MNPESSTNIPIIKYITFGLLLLKALELDERKLGEYVVPLSRFKFPINLPSRFKSILVTFSPL